jgi:hypothetical protein
LIRHLVISQLPDCRFASLVAGNNEPNQWLGKSLNPIPLNLGALLPLSHLPLVFKGKKNYGNV